MYPANFEKINSRAEKPAQGLASKKKTVFKLNLEALQWIFSGCMIPLKRNEAHKV